MKKSLLKDVAQARILNISIFGLLTFALVSILLWNFIIGLQKCRLMTLTGLVEVVLEDNARLLQTKRFDAKRLHDALEPRIARIIQCYPTEYTAGFYAKDLDRVVASASRIPSVNLDGVILPDKDPGRRSWLVEKPQYSFVWRSYRKAWVLKCDRPVLLGGRVIGHAFANVTLSQLIGFHLSLTAGLLAAIFFAGGLSIFSSRRITRRIKENAQRLLLMDSQAAQRGFDYEEFDHIAKLNQDVLADLRLSEMNKADMLANFPWGYVVVDSSGAIVDINENGAMCLCTKSEEAIGTHILDYGTKDLLIEAIGAHLLDHDTKDQLIARAFREKTHIEQEFSYRSPNGQRRYYYVSAFPFVLNSGEQGAMAWFIDITERKEMEERLRKLATIVESSQDAILGIGLDGKIGSWNPAAEKLYGYGAEEMLGHCASTIIPPETQPYIAGALERFGKGENFGVFDTTRLHRNGKRINVLITLSPIRDENGEIVGLASIHRDITTQKRIEAELAAEQELLSVTLNSIGDGVITIDEHAAITFMNRTAQQITGWAFSAAKGMELSQVFNVHDTKSDPRSVKLIRSILDTGKAKRLDGVVLVNKEQPEIPISIHAAPIKTSSGEHPGAVLVFQDVTEKLRIERELLKTEKLESLGILAGGIAHDFNNILAASLANVQLALARLKKGRPVEDCLQETVETIYKASTLTKQLLTFAKGGEPIKKTASIAELITETSRFALRGTNVKCRCDLPKDLWVAEIDEGQISQVIHNLVINAKQAMPGGGVIEIAAANVMLDAGCYKPGPYIRLRIKDSGVGIPAENLAKIFDPFFTTKKDGTGLGLSTSFAILKKHEGYIEVDSKPGEGTTFTLHLPASPGGLRMPEIRQERVINQEGLKVLLMDDEEMILKNVGEMLAEAGYQVALARDGREAVEMYLRAKEIGEPFQAVIVDLTVPGGMGGREVVTYLRQIDSQLKAIVSSGYANDPIMSSYAQYGFCGVVTKPYKFEELKTVLQQALLTEHLLAMPPRSAETRH